MAEVEGGSYVDTESERRVQWEKRTEGRNLSWMKKKNIGCQRRCPAPDSTMIHLAAHLGWTEHIAQLELR